MSLDFWFHLFAWKLSEKNYPHFNYPLRIPKENIFLNSRFWIQNIFQTFFWKMQCFCFSKLKSPPSEFMENLEKYSKKHCRWDCHQKNIQKQMQFQTDLKNTQKNMQKILENI